MCFVMENVANFVFPRVGGFNEAKYGADNFVPYVEEAIKNAIALDINPRTRWPNYLATRVYKLVQNIIFLSL